MPSVSALRKEAKYRLGGAHCHACVYFEEAEDESETGNCKKGLGQVQEHMVCDWFKRMADMAEAEASGESEGEGENGGAMLMKGRMPKMPAKHMALILMGKPRG